MSHYKPYQAYKDSGVKWIGQVPVHWRIVPLKSLADTLNGATPESTKAEYWDGGIAWYTPTDLDNENATELADPRRYISQAGFDSCAVKLAPPGSVILSTRAPIGSVGITSISSTTNQGCRTLVPASDVPARFLASIMVAARNELRLRGNGTTFQELSTNALRSLRAPCPPRIEQNAIEATISRETTRIDTLIEKKTRFIALLNEKEKALISGLVRMGAGRNATLIDSGFDWRGMVPSHWRKDRLKDHFRQEKRQGYEYLTVLSVYREFGVIEKSSRDDNINKTPEDLSKYQLVNPNDLVINKMKAWQGSMGIAGIKGITSPDYVVMRPVGEHDPRYMHHYLRAQPMPWVYRLISNGIRTDQWRMEPEKFLSLPIFMPPLEEQRLIADQIDAELERIRGLTSLTERSIHLLKEKRSALITAAVTGKIDVRAAA